jgi:hypothetical protein
MCQKVAFGCALRRVTGIPVSIQKNALLSAQFLFIKVAYYFVVLAFLCNNSRRYLKKAQI